MPSRAGVSVDVCIGATVTIARAKGTVFAYAQTPLSGYKSAHGFGKKAVFTFHPAYPAIGCTIAKNAADARATLTGKIDQTRMSVWEAPHR